MENKTLNTLLELGLCRKESIASYYPRVRDRDDVGVLRDEQSGVIFLDRSDHMEIAHYETVEGGSYWGAKDRKEALEKYREDDERRAKQFASYFQGKDFVDVGCGTGGLLDLTRENVKSIAGVEPQTYIREELEKEGYAMYPLSSNLPIRSFDVAGLFHTLEHLTDPITTLRDIRKTLRPGGLLIVEVPHANDALLSLEVFRKFTLWSEHLILHTQESLQKLLEAGGFVNIRIEGFQRYPISNHLGWLIDGLPGGQNKFPQLRNKEMETVYEDTLKLSNRTDTLIAFASV